MDLPAFGVGTMAYHMCGGHEVMLGLNAAGMSVFGWLPSTGALGIMRAARPT